MAHAARRLGGTLSVPMLGLRRRVFFLIDHAVSFRASNQIAVSSHLANGVDDGALLLELIGVVAIELCGTLDVPVTTLLVVKLCEKPHCLPAARRAGHGWCTRVWRRHGVQLDGVTQSTSAGRL